MRSLVYCFLLTMIMGLFNRVFAQPALTVAVAANFAPAMERIGKRFTSETGIPVQVTISSSGRLFAQIKNKAPFDLYFSADAERPEMLHSEGLCHESRLYAWGQSVLWSKNKAVCAQEDWKQVVDNPEVKKIAIPNPKTAPYGTVARDACIKHKNWKNIEKKFVYGSNVGQAFQYAEAGVADVAFIAKSLALTEKGQTGCTWDIPGSAPVKQKACATTYRMNQKDAARLLEYATSEQTADIRNTFGYR